MEERFRLEHCIPKRVLGLVANRWTILVIYALRGGTKRFAELERAIEGVSQKMLAQTLRELERDGLVSRTIFPEVPPRVEYRLTELGTSLAPLLESLRAWADAHMADVVEARVRYDARNEPAEEAPEVATAEVPAEVPVELGADASRDHVPRNSGTSFPAEAAD